MCYVLCDIFTYIPFVVYFNLSLLAISMLYCI